MDFDSNEKRTERTNINKMLEEKRGFCENAGRQCSPDDWERK